ncbi:MAG: hypothetical protein AABZ00_00150 [Chloroflexota bacterium]
MSFEEVVTGTTSMLWNAIKAAKVAVDADYRSSPHSHVVAPDTNPIVITPNKNMNKNTLEWLNSVGLKINPFATLDASEDPFIPFYLVDHDQYKSISGDVTSFVFAPPGSGKSAFRVRLARDCRVGKNGRKIFPIIYNLPNPESVKNSNLGLNLHYKRLAKSADRELLLYLVYHATSIIKDKNLLMEICQIFDFNSPVDYLQQMVDKGSVKPLLDSFDKTAGLLPNPPSKKDIILLVEQLNKFRNPAVAKLEPRQRFEKIVGLILEKLGYEAIYILIDGVDGYVETGEDAKKGVEAISWLLEKNNEWRENKIFTKYFLPIEMQDELQFLLTSKSEVTTITWDADALGEVVQQRLQEASGGKYSSLRAISSLPLRGAKQSPEEVLAQEIVKLGNPNPRDLIKTVDRLFVYHVQNEVQEKLTPKDMAAAVDWIRKERSLKPRHA